MLLLENEPIAQLEYLTEKVLKKTHMPGNQYLMTT